MRIGKHIPSDGAYEDHDDGDGMEMIKVLGLEKEEREKQKAQSKGDIHRSFCVLVIETLSECDHI
jgi:hypothetical protein